MGTEFTPALFLRMKFIPAMRRKFARRVLAIAGEDRFGVELDTMDGIIGGGERPMIFTFRRAGINDESLGNGGADQ